MRSALGIVIGLAARAEVTLFDEPYAGLDPMARQLFYDRLLADYAQHPRTILLSTHLIDEAAGLFERVVVIDRGRIALNSDADDLRGAATSVSGPAIAVAEFTAGRSVWNRRRIASQESAVVAGTLDETDRARAAALHLHLEPLTLQQVVVQRGGYTSRNPAGKDKRMNTWIKRRPLPADRPEHVRDLTLEHPDPRLPAQPGHLRQHSAPPRPGLYTGALSAIYVVLLVSGAMNISRQLPFALALGGLTGLLAALTVALLVGGYATVRRLAV